MVNFSAQGMVAESWKNPLDWYQTNLISQVDLHDQIRIQFHQKCLNFSMKFMEVSRAGKKYI